MVDTLLDLPTTHEEIPAYVVRSAARRQPIYRTETLAERLNAAWQRAGGQARIASVIAVPQEHSVLEPVGVMRYEATLLRPMRRRAPSLASHPAPWFVASVVLAGVIGWVIGTHQLHPTVTAERPQAIPAAPVAAPVKPAPIAQLPAQIAQKPTALIAAAKPTQAGQKPAAVPVAAKPATDQPRKADTTYVVQAGDSFSSVGSKFHLRGHTVRLVNELPLGYRLKPGQSLVIPPLDGAYHHIRSGETVGILATRYGVSHEQIMAHNPGLNSSHMHIGQKVFIPGATEVLTGDGGPRGYRKDAFGERLSVSRSLIGEFGNRVGTLLKPAVGDYSSPFGIRGHSFHPGLDISGAIGRPIHAAKAGTVISAGWMGAYGNCVDIDHGGGVVTRYGHCSRLLVHVGQTVAAGQEIAKMGSTGMSTGPHVHFEVRIQGRAVNPIGFL